MLPDSLLYLYQQYKEDTRTICQYITFTARSNGYKPKSSPTAMSAGSGPSAASAGTGRLKGKARKAAKEAQDVNPAARDEPISMVSTAEIAAMADFLSSKPSITVPSYFAGALGRAIRDRKSFSQRRRGEIAQPDERVHGDSDETHRHFVTVLEHVRRALQPKMDLAAKEAFKKISAQPGSLDEMASRFEHLDVFEPSEAFVNAPDVVIQKPSGAHANVNVETWRDDFDEAMFMWRTCHATLQRLRQSIITLWKRYRSGELGLAGVGAAHNTVLHVVKAMEDDMMPVLNHHGGVSRFIMTAYHDDCVAHMGPIMGEDPRIPMRVAALWTGSLDEEGIETIEMLARVADNIAQSHLMFANAGLWHAIQHGPPEPGSGYLPSEVLTPAYYNHIMRMLFWDLDRTGRRFSEHVGVYPDAWMESINEFTTEQEKCGDDGTRTKLKLALLFGAQLSLDCLTVLGSESQRPATEFLAASAAMYQSSEALRDFYEAQDAGFKEHAPEDALEMPPASLERLGPWCREGHSYRYLKLSPLLSGWWMQVSRNYWYTEGLTACLRMETPLYCARMYQAMVHQRLIPAGSWPDMEAFCTLHRESIWMGKKIPTFAYCKNHALAEGLGRNWVLRPKRKTLKFDNTVCWRIYELFHTQAIIGLEEDDIRSILRDGKALWHPVKKCFYFKCPHHGDTQVRRCKQAKSQPKGRPDVYPDQLLHLALAIDAEEAQQAFDYQTFYRACEELNELLAAEAGPIVRRAGFLDTICTRKNKDIAQYVLGAIDYKMSGSTDVPGYYSLVDPLDPQNPRPQYRAAADIYAGVTKSFVEARGMDVYKSTGRDWKAELRCTCEDEPGVFPCSKKPSAAAGHQEGEASARREGQA